jgi:hypothetical protein
VGLYPARAVRYFAGLVDWLPKDLLTIILSLSAAGLCHPLIKPCPIELEKAFEQFKEINDTTVCFR